jgi:hypothetical protein
MIAHEHRIQVACVRWFALQWPQYEGLLFAVPNGGHRDKVTAAMMKAEGVTAGVADLLLLVPSQGLHGLAIEMKTENGRQSPEQKQWQKKAERQGYRYAVCRSLDQFIETVNAYLHQD